MPRQRLGLACVLVVCGWLSTELSTKLWKADWNIRSRRMDVAAWCDRRLYCSRREEELAAFLENGTRSVCIQLGQDSRIL